MGLGQFTHGPWCRRRVLVNRNSPVLRPSNTENLNHVTIALNVTTTGRIKVTELGEDISDAFESLGAAFPAHRIV